MPKLKPYALRAQDRLREEIVTIGWFDARRRGWPLPICAEIERLRTGAKIAHLLKNKGAR